MSGGDTALTFFLLLFILFYCLAPVIHYCIRCNDFCSKTKKKYQKSKTNKSNVTKQQQSETPIEMTHIERESANDKRPHKTQEQIDDIFKDDVSFWRYISKYFHFGVCVLVLFVILINTTNTAPDTQKGLSALCYVCLSVSILCILYEILAGYECCYLWNLKQEKPLLDYLKGTLMKTGLQKSV